MAKNTQLLVVLIISLVGFTPLVLSANYPSPFVQRGAPDVAVVYGNSQQIEGTKNQWDLEIKGRMWSEDEICKFIKGCFDEEKALCYQQGYIRNNQYCGTYFIHNSFERQGFMNQSNSEEICYQDYQCKSNFCFNGKCVGSFQILIKDVLSRLSKLENKYPKPESLSEKTPEQNFEELNVENNQGSRDVIEVISGLFSKNG